MKGAIKILLSFLTILMLSSFSNKKQETCSLTVDVSGLRNSKGTVQFALYNREDAFPDEHYKKFFKKLTGEIVNGTSTITFKNLPEGKYAVSTSNRNFEGRQGPGARTMLASPLMVAAAAVTGVVSDPRDF